MNLKNRSDQLLIVIIAVLTCAMLSNVYTLLIGSVRAAAGNFRSFEDIPILPALSFPWESSPVDQKDGGTQSSGDASAADAAAPPADGTSETPDAPDGMAETPDAHDGTSRTDALPADSSPVFVTADKSYFDDALFIGDSRTVDLRDFGGLDNADFYARVGMSVFNLNDKDVDMKNIGAIKLERLLETRSYGKIYIMLGYNEIGYRFNVVIKKYRSLIDEIRAKQPGAIIYLQANLLVSQKYSDAVNDADNPSLIELNRRISELADNETVFYIDVNPVFCENGALREELSGDGAHPYAKHYKTWAQWLCENTVESPAPSRRLNYQKP